MVYGHPSSTVTREPLQFLITNLGHTVASVLH